MSVDLPFKHKMKINQRKFLRMILLKNSLMRLKDHDAAVKTQMPLLESEIDGSINLYSTIKGGLPTIKLLNIS